MDDARLMPRWKISIATGLGIAVAMNYFLIAGRSTGAAIGGGVAAGVTAGVLFLALPTYLYRRFISEEDRGRYITGKNWRRGGIIAAVLGIVVSLFAGAAGSLVFIVLAPPAAGVAQLVSSNWKLISEPSRQ